MPNDSKDGQKSVQEQLDKSNAKLAALMNQWSEANELLQLHGINMIRSPSAPMKDEVREKKSNEKMAKITIDCHKEIQNIKIMHFFYRSTINSLN